MRKGEHRRHVGIRTISLLHVRHTVCLRYVAGCNPVNHQSAITMCTLMYFDIAHCWPFYLIRFRFSNTLIPFVNLSWTQILREAVWLVRGWPLPFISYPPVVALSVYWYITCWQTSPSLVPQPIRWRSQISLIIHVTLGTSLPPNPGKVSRSTVWVSGRDIM